MMLVSIRNVKRLMTLCIYLFFVLTQLKASTYFVAPTGKNSNTGTINAPFQTIAYALTKAKVAGDTIYVRAGTYRETANFLYGGSISARITLTAYNHEQVIISGNDVYNNLVWTPNTSNPAIYHATYTDATFEQMFFNGKPMIQARWPNLPTKANGDWDQWSTNKWADTDTGSYYGKIKDSALAKSSLNANGAWAVLNVNHQYYVWTRKVLNHVAGSDTFNYTQDLGQSISTTVSNADDRYYLFGKLSFLDAPGEWYNDTITKTLYFYPPNGLNPNNIGIEIKRRNYGLTASNKDYLTINGITFFATAFQFNSLNSGSDYLIFSNNTIQYSSFTEFYNVVAGQTGTGAEAIFPTIFGSNCKVYGNIFTEGALSALLISGFNNLIENNIAYNFDYNSSLVTPLFQVSRTWDAYIGKAGNAIVRYNTFYNSGGVILSVGQSNNEVYQNYCYNAFLACFGGNKDHSMFYTNCQTNSSATLGTRFHHNWLHDGYAGTTPSDWGKGIGIRGDDNTSGITVDHNVIWNFGSTGIQIKSPDTPSLVQANVAANNTIFRTSRDNTPQASIILQSRTNNQNKYSSIYNNIGKGIFGAFSGLKLIYVTQIGNNYNNSALPVEDTLDYDFRPLSNSTTLINKGKTVGNLNADVTDGLPDIGAYERGIHTYFIPGFRDVKASFPILPNNKTNVAITRDQVMWKPAYNAIYHLVYFGLSPDSLFLMQTDSAEHNVYKLPTLKAATKYYWRIDSKMADSSTSIGDIWSFTTLAFPLPISLIYFSGMPVGDVNKIIWKVSDNANLSSCVLQKSTNLIDWTTIYSPIEVDLFKKYIFEDYPISSNCNYRLLFQDNNGKATYSNIISIKRGIKNKVDVKTIVTYQSVKIKLITNDGAMVNPYSIAIYDIKGRKLYQQLTHSRETEVNISNYQAGVYLLKLESSNINSIRKFVK